MCCEVASTQRGLYCIVLYCIVLYCIVLYCIVLQLLSVTPCLASTLGCVWRWRPLSEDLFVFVDHLGMGISARLLKVKVKFSGGKGKERGGRRDKGRSGTMWS